jgi:cold shock protein
VSVEETGTVNWFNTETSYSFITRDDGEKDVFVHISTIGISALSEGDRLIVDVVEGRKGTEAASVRFV